MAYLDDTGLAYFWGKIKAWAQGLFALIGHTHPSSDVTAMTGYSKPASGSAIAAGDTLNQAVGKLEAKVDAADGLYVHLSGNEDVSGNKHFKNWCIMEDGFRMHADKSDEFSKGSNPPATSYGTIFMVGDGEFGVGDQLANRLLEYNCSIDTSGITRQIFRVYNNTANATDAAELGIVNDHGTSYAYCPTPAANSNDTKIATTAWVRTFGGSTYLPLTGGTLTGALKFARSNITRGTAPSSESVLSLASCVDSANNRISLIESSYYTDMSSKVALFAYNTTIASGANIGSLGIGCTSTGSVYTFCPTPATSDNSTQIATTAYVKNQGYITSSGNASGLVSMGLGSNYEMTPADFDNRGIGIWKADFKANTTSAPRYNDGDFAIMKLYNTTGTSYAQFLCMSPRRDIIYFGKFWNGTWQKWNEIFCSSQHIRLNEGNTILRTVDTDAVYICGGTSIDSSAHLSLRGKSKSTSAGTFDLVAQINSTSKSLYGTSTGTLQWNGQNVQVSSDERLKTPLSSVPDSILDAWGDVEWGQFQYLEAVKEKGENARLHLGMIAQKVKKAFEAKELDACKYGILCHEERPEVNEEKKIVDCREYTDEDGVFHPEEYHVEKYHEDAVDLWMVRYAEALCMEAAYQRRENARLRARLASFEDRLAALELRFGSE